MFNIRKAGKSFLARIGVAAALFLAGSVAQAATFVYTGGHSIDNARLAALGHTSSYFYPDDAGWAAVLAGGNGPFDAVIIGESQDGNSLSPATKAAIAAYVSGGGRVIIVGDHEGSLDVLNPVFGYSAVLSYGCESDNSVTGLLQTAAAGTSFASGPPGVANLSCTSGLVSASLPASATSMYAGDYYATPTTLVFVSAFGSGTLAWLGYDLYSEVDQAHMDDWYIVLDNAYKYVSLVTSANLRMSFSGPSTPVRSGTTVPVYARVDNYGRDAARNPVVNLTANALPYAVSATAPTGWACQSTSVNPEKSIASAPTPINTASFRCTANAGTMPRTSVLFTLRITAPASAAGSFVTIGGTVASDSTDPVPSNNTSSFKLYVKSLAMITPVAPPSH